MTIDKAITAKVARLARLDLNNEELTRLADDLGSIFRWIDQLSKIDVEGVDPLYNVCDARLPLREDIVDHQDCSGDLMALAQVHKDNLFLVPKVITQD